MNELYKKFLAVEQDMNSILVERNDPVRGVMVATISGTNILLLGKAGVAKSALIDQWNRRITDSIYFEWLLSKFSTPEELFGPYSFTQLEYDRFVRMTKGKLPEAGTAFIDEIFKGNPSILNAMLKILNERVFHNDYKPTKLDLITVAGASNEIPDTDDGLDAFVDRFLLKYEVERIQEDGNFLKMLDVDIDREPTAFLSKTEILEAQALSRKIAFPDAMKKLYVSLRKSLHAEGFSVSDRTYRIAPRILKAQAFLAGRDAVDTPDFEIFKNIAWVDPSQKQKARTVVLDLVAPEKNRIFEILDMSRVAFNKVMEIKVVENKKRTEAANEVMFKLKDGLKDIAKLKTAMSSRSSDLSEVDQIEADIESMKRTLIVDVIGLGKFIK